MFLRVESWSCTARRAAAAHAARPRARRRLAAGLAVALAWHSVLPCRAARAAAPPAAPPGSSCTLRRGLVGSTQPHSGGQRLLFAAGTRVRVLGRSGDSVHLATPSGLRGWLDARALAQACSSAAAELRALQDMPLEPLPPPPPTPAPTPPPAPPPAPLLPPPTLFRPDPVAPAPYSAMPPEAYEPAPERAGPPLALARALTLGVGAGLGVASLTLLTVGQVRGHRLSRDIQAYNGQVRAGAAGGEDPGLALQALEATGEALSRRERSLRELDTATWACGIGAAVVLAGGGLWWWLERRRPAAAEPELSLGLRPAGMELVGRF